MLGIGFVIGALKRFSYVRLDNALHLGNLPGGMIFCGRISWGFCWGYGMGVAFLFRGEEGTWGSGGSE